MRCKVLLVTVFLFLPLALWAHEANTGDHLIVKIINGDEVVIDSKYNLMWERKGENGSSLVTGDTLYTWEEALDYAEYLNTIAYAGRSDWRVPSAYEMATIVDISVGEPAIDPVAFPNTGYKHFWTRSEYPPVPSVVQYTNFIKGNQFKWLRTGQMRVRCVAGGGFIGLDFREEISGRYDVTDYTVTDNVTGLTWERKIQNGEEDYGDGPIGEYGLEFMANLVIRAPEMAWEVLYEEFYLSGFYVDNLITANTVFSIPQVIFDVVFHTLGDFFNALYEEFTGIDFANMKFSPRVVYLVRSYEEAEEYIAWLNDVNFGGYSDWRIPEQMEMMTTIDWDELPTVKEVFMPASFWIYWTSTKDPDGKNHYFT